MVDAYEIRMRRSDLADCTAVAVTPPRAEADAVVVRLERAALTANNVTYAMMGDSFHYWRFFPAPEGFGIVPVWGFATVEESAVDGLAVGARVWGYFPLATHLRLTPMAVSARGFEDGAAHRAGLARVYNRYEFAPIRAPREEALEALFRPLLMTSFLIDAHFAAAAEHGAARVAFASASSKTALGAALLMRRRGVETVGLTSARNVGFCMRTGAYDRVVAYDDLAALPIDRPVALVDMAGDAGLIGALAERLGPAFVHDCMVGATHSPTPQAEGGARLAKGPPRSLFFAPSVMEALSAELGPAAFMARFHEAWEVILASLTWLEIVEAAGADAILAQWRRQLSGAVEPQEGIILRF